jgi:hypothetical protein
MTNAVRPIADDIAPAEIRVPGDRRPGLAGLSLALYLAALLIDAVRKVTSMPSSAIGVIYVITAVIYVTAIPRAAAPTRGARKTLPLLLFLLSLWCLVVALTQRIPAEMALLGWASYVFFVPLAYVGAELTADDGLAAKTLRAVTIGGGAVGAVTVISAILGHSAPVLLQPIVPSVGFHTFGTSPIYLASSLFATAEEASEQLLVALFAWIALAHLDRGRTRRMPSAVLGALIIAGLLFTARRADVYVAAGGIVAVLILERIRISSSARPRASREPARIRGRLGLPVFVAVVGSAALLFLLGGSALRSFLVSGSAGERLSQMFSLTSSGFLTGQGPGTSTQGAAALAPGGAPILSAALSGSTSSYVMNGQTFITAESSLEKTWLELGIMGLALYTAVFLAALSPAIRFLRRMDGAGTALTVLAIALGVIFLKGHQSLDNPLIQPLFWLAVGGIWGRMRALFLTDR